MLNLDRLNAAYQKAKAELLAERTPAGHWVGELSSSALSTATAVSALAVVRSQEAQASGRREPPGKAESPSGSVLLDDLIRRGVAYLVTQQNDDGGFGDTDLSHSNIATTMLVVAALHLAGRTDEYAGLLQRANAYIDAQGRLEGLQKRYGIDKTFVVPIMTNCAIAGLIDWREIDPLPFEMATVPQAWYRFVGMPVVSYAIPALVAIGQAQYFHAPPWNPITRVTRWLSITRSLKVLRRMQPDSGGYLEATPLTSFVVMSLASAKNQASGRHKPPGHVERSGDPPGDSRLPLAESLSAEVIRHGVQFLIDSIRPDGSWPIDTNLATWNTTLAINALAGAGEDVAELLGVSAANAAGAVGNALRGVPDSPAEPVPANPGTAQSAFPTDGTAQRPFPTSNLLDWLLSCQHNKRHPFTGADPGGFGWSDLSGAVPDADDTPGALLAIAAVRSSSIPVLTPSPEDTGLRWIGKLQNRDGGWPTFCRGWGRLPFDRSGTDLTAHVLRAIRRWWPRYYTDLAVRVPIFRSALGFLRNRQHPDGSWSPLWFGNQDHPEEDNPVYGTAKVLMAYRDLGLMDSPEAQRGVAWLVANQNADGGWGSGVWGRLRNADCGLRIVGNAEREAGDGVETGRVVTGPAGAGHSVMGTQYSGLGTRPDQAQPGAEPLIRDPQSAIQNLQSSIEETAIAVEALLAACPKPRTVNPHSNPGNATEGVPYSDSPTSDLRPPTSAPASAANRGIAWLIDRVEAGQHRQPAPIGFYFAKLWYYEKLYPLTFTVAALGRARRQFARLEQPDSPAELAPSRAP